ncbi:MAG: L-serine ammonia-lyase, iron-sulfur-dependent, subunit beta [Hungatella sp.]|nr:L-serine ammonia-lyase, iron-sulfur-dependent, subunit beta [Hungatella sp.]
MNIFDILGPVMVGPSSSHTAGAVRIGLVTKKLLGAVPVKAVITLSGSFSATGVGHGTDRALVAGLLGMKPDNICIPESFEYAKKEGMEFSFIHENIRGAHPNTALLEVWDSTGRTVAVQASSLGGGRIMVNKLDGVQIDVTAERPALIVHNLDQPGHVAEVTSMLAHKSINIATLNLYRNKRGGDAVMVIETDQNIPASSLEWLKRVEGIMKVTCLNLGEEEG